VGGDGCQRQVAGREGERTGHAHKGGARGTLTVQSSLAVSAKVSSCENSTDVTVLECPCGRAPPDGCHSCASRIHVLYQRQIEIDAPGPRGAPEDGGTQGGDLKDVEEGHLAASVPQAGRAITRCR
jgi:hypothetical protein